MLRKLVKLGRNKLSFSRRSPESAPSRASFAIALAVVAILSLVATWTIASPLDPQYTRVSQQSARENAPAGQDDAVPVIQEASQPGSQKEALVGVPNTGLTATVSGVAGPQPGVDQDTREAIEQPTPQPEPTPTAATKVDDKRAPEPRGGERLAHDRVVVIDPGHGGPRDFGANRAFPDGYFMKESDLNLQVSLAFAARLRDAGIRTILTREKDTTVNNPPRDATGNGVISDGDELQARVDIANNAHADLFVSVHFNAAGSPMGGTEVFYCADRPFADKSKKMADFLQSSLLSAIRELGYDPPNRGVKVDTLSAARTHLYVLGPRTGMIAKSIAMPSVLGEALFISNPTEGPLLRETRTLEAIAEAYANAVMQYFEWLEL